jgi:hypothetical protein
MQLPACFPAFSGSSAAVRRGGLILAIGIDSIQSNAHRSAQKNGRGEEYIFGAPGLIFCYARVYGQANADWNRLSFTS